MDKTRMFMWIAIGVLALLCIGFAVVAFTDSSNDSSDLTLTAPTDSLDVTAYGAKGDGTTDDGPSIVAASTAAAGRVLYFPSGNYFVANTAILPIGWPSGWKGAGGEGEASYIMSTVTAGDGQTAWDYRWIAP